MLIDLAAVKKKNKFKRNIKGNGEYYLLIEPGIVGWRHTRFTTILLFSRNAFFAWVLRRTKVIWQLSRFTGEGRHYVHLRALFQARMVIWVERPRRAMSYLNSLFRSHCRDCNTQRWGASDCKSTTLSTRPRHPFKQAVNFLHNQAELNAPS